MGSANIDYMRLMFVSFLLLLAFSPEESIAQSCSETKLKDQAGQILSACQSNVCRSQDNQLQLSNLSLQQTEDSTRQPIWQKPGHVYDQFYNVQAYANNSAGTYQCTELVHRFVNSVYGVPSKIGIGLGHAKDLSRNIKNRFQNIKINNSHTNGKEGRLAYIENGCSSNPPMVGSIISLEYSKFGHIAIIRDIQILSENSMEITLFEQHGLRNFQVGKNKPLTKVILTKNSKGQWSGPKVIGWVNVVESQ